MASIINSTRSLMAGVSLILLAACDGGGSESSSDDAVQQLASAEDDLLRALIATLEINVDATQNRTLPAITDPLPQLGQLLFFSTSLGGGFDAACVSCHHPVLGGSDQLALSVGVDALRPELLGAGRVHNGGQPLVPRNAPTVFNVGLIDSGLFWDSRVESLGAERGQNGTGSGIRTPDSAFGVADPNAGTNLVAAQARFPVTSSDEMKTAAFENASDNNTIRNHLAARIGDYGVATGELSSTVWLSEFQLGFDSTATSEDLITYDNIAHALGEYQRSMVFIDNPWKAYVEGDDAALTDEQKAGAMLFFTAVNEGGAGCSNCHSGPLLSNSNHEIVAFPQVGPGKGDGSNDDYGRERETGDRGDRYRFRVPSLLNVEMTPPYGHSGAYGTLEEVVRHYDNPERTVNDYFAAGGWCQLRQFSTITSCGSLYPDAQANSALALEALARTRQGQNPRFANINLNDDEVEQLVSFLQALTDPCVKDRDCLAPWIADNSLTGPDGQQLNAVDESSTPL